MLQLDSRHVMTGAAGLASATHRRTAAMALRGPAQAAVQVSETSCILFMECKPSALLGAGAGAPGLPAKAAWNDVVASNRRHNVADSAQPEQSIEQTLSELTAIGRGLHVGSPAAATHTLLGAVVDAQPAHEAATSAIAPAGAVEQPCGQLLHVAQAHDGDWHVRHTIECPVGLWTAQALYHIDGQLTLVAPSCFATTALATQPGATLQAVEWLVLSVPAARVPVGLACIKPASLPSSVRHLAEPAGTHCAAAVASDVAARLPCVVFTAKEDAPQSTVLRAGSVAKAGGKRRKLARTYIVLPSAWHPSDDEAGHALAAPVRPPPEPAVQASAAAPADPAPARPADLSDDWLAKLSAVGVQLGSHATGEIITTPRAASTALPAAPADVQPAPARQAIQPAGTPSSAQLAAVVLRTQAAAVAARAVAATAAALEVEAGPSSSERLAACIAEADTAWAAASAAMAAADVHLRRLLRQTKAVTKR